MSLPAFSVRQVVLVNLIFILLMVAGIQIARRIPVDMFPDISFNTATVRTPWAGASPEEVERLLTKKLEDEIDTITGIKEILSYSRTRGLFAGVSLEGAVVKQDKNANKKIYGEAVDPEELLLRAGYRVPESGRGLVDLLNGVSPRSLTD